MTLDGLEHDQRSSPVNIARPLAPHRQPQLNKNYN